MIQVNALGDACPIPVVKTKKAIQELGGPGVVETLVDNEIAVQNLMKMAAQKGYGAKSEKLAEGRFKVTMAVEGAAVPTGAEEGAACPAPGAGRGTLVAISSSQMGQGSEELGRTLLKGFLYALAQMDELPQTLLFYNGGAAMTCEGSPALEDIRSMEARGVEVLTCGTCLNFYGLTDKLRAGEATNMYTIAEKLAGAGHIIKP